MCKRSALDSVRGPLTEDYSLQRYNCYTVVHTNKIHEHSRNAMTVWVRGTDEANKIRKNSEPPPSTLLPVYYYYYYIIFFFFYSTRKRR